MLCNRFTWLLTNIFKFSIGEFQCFPISWQWHIYLKVLRIDWMSFFFCKHPIQVTYITSKCWGYILQKFYLKLYHGLIKSYSRQVIHPEFWYFSNLLNNYLPHYVSSYLKYNLLSILTIPWLFSIHAHENMSLTTISDPSFVIAWILKWSTLKSRSDCSVGLWNNRWINWWSTKSDYGLFQTS